MKEKKFVDITEAFGEPFYLPKADGPGLESLRGVGSTQDDPLTCATMRQALERLGLPGQWGAQ